jgi:hypothetical protein
MPFSFAVENIKGFVQGFAPFESVRAGSVSTTRDLVRDFLPGVDVALVDALAAGVDAAQTPDRIPPHGYTVAFRAASANPLHQSRSTCRPLFKIRAALGGGEESRDVAFAGIGLRRTHARGAAHTSDDLSPKWLQVREVIHSTEPYDQTLPRPATEARTTRTRNTISRFRGGPRRISLPQPQKTRETTGVRAGCGAGEEAGKP